MRSIITVYLLPLVLRGDFFPALWRLGSVGAAPTSLRSYLAAITCYSSRTRSMQQFNNNSTEDTVSKGLGFLVPGYPFMDPWVCRWFSVWAKKKSRLSDVAAIFLPSCLRCKRANWKKKKKRHSGKLSFRGDVVLEQCVLGASQIMRFVHAPATRPCSRSEARKSHNGPERTGARSLRLPR